MKETICIYYIDDSNKYTKSHFFETCHLALFFRTSAIYSLATYKIHILDCHSMYIYTGKYIIRMVSQVNELNPSLSHG